MIVKYGNNDKSLILNKGEAFKGDDGGYYIPSVDDEGNLSWTPTEENMETPLEVNIRGPQGEPGVDGNDNVYVGAEEPSSEHLIWINPEEELDNEGFATKEYVDKAIAQAQLEGEEVDLNGYYTKTEVDNKIEQIELTPGPAGPQGEKGDKGDTGAQGIQGEKGEQGEPGADYVLTDEDKAEIAGMVEVSGDGTDLSNYYTKTEVDNKIPSLDGYAKTSDIPDVSGFTTMAAVEGKGYQTEAQVNTLIETALGVIENGTY